MLAPVSIYAGWLTAASFVSLGSTLAGYGILFGSWGWALICILGALAVAVPVFWARKDAPGYLLTVIWALAGIIVANGTNLPSVSYLASAGIITLIIVLITSRLTAQVVRVS